MTLPIIAKFNLALNLHTELGWTDLVRHATTRSPAVIGHLLHHRDFLPICEDPVTILESWQPILGYCVHFIRQRQALATVEWVVTDGIFNQVIPMPAPDAGTGSAPDSGCLALMRHVFGLARAACQSACPGAPFPLIPQAHGLPAAVILHRFGNGEALIVPYAAALQALTHREQL